jgi:hypothetical protein
MKKWLTGICILIILSIAVVYIFIPGTLIVSKIVPVQCNVRNANKFLGDRDNWPRWWPVGGEGAAGGGRRDSGYVYGGMRYQMTAPRFQHVMEVTIDSPDLDLRSQIAVIAVADNIDSTILKWECQLQAGWNPIDRVKQYQQAKRVKENMEGILYALRAFVENKVNVYVLVIRQTSTKDSFLVGIKSVFANYPGTADISPLLKKLKKYMVDEKARETGYPMLNITDLQQGKYQVMVAIPEDKELTGNRELFTRRLTPGRYLTTEVKGGERTVVNAIAKMQEYMADYERASMAIPFQSLITDRSAEPDTTKWVTRIYYPVY